MCRHLPATQALTLIFNNKKKNLYCAFDMAKKLEIDIPVVKSSILTLELMGLTCLWSQAPVAV